MWCWSRAAASGHSTDRPRVGTPTRRAPAGYASLVALALVGCRPSIGDRCTLSTDCSAQGDRPCDTAQPGGYCTALNCTDDSCPDHAVCVLFGASVPGCAYSDYSSPGRFGQSFCMAHCNGDSDCRQGDGYVCANPRSNPWYAAILDDNQNQRVCIAASQQVSMAPDADVCAATLPPIPEAGGESPVDATVDAPVDGSGEVPGDGSGSPADGPGDALGEGSGETGEGSVPIGDGTVDAFDGAGDAALGDGPLTSGDAAEGAVVDGPDESPDASMGDGAAEGSVDAELGDAPDGG
jgi:hypothetical protein